MPITEIHRPADLAAAAELLSRTDEHIVPIAVSPRMPVEPYAGADAVVDLSRLKLSYITEDEAGIHIGALTPLQDIAEAELLRGVANGIVCEAAELAAHLGLRNIATLGGALASTDGPQELRLALEALHSWTIYQSDARLNCPVAVWSDGRGKLLLEVCFVHPPKRTGGALERIARSPRDASIVSVAAVEYSGYHAHYVFGPTPVQRGDIWRGVGVEAIDEPPYFRIASDRPIDDLWTGIESYHPSPWSLSEFYNPPSDFRASAEYRKAMAGVLVQRALERAWQRARQRARQ